MNIKKTLIKLLTKYDVNHIPTINRVIGETNT